MPSSSSADDGKCRLLYIICLWGLCWNIHISFFLFFFFFFVAVVVVFRMGNCESYNSISKGIDYCMTAAYCVVLQDSLVWKKSVDALL
jgi:hypothetical protein